MNRLRSSPSAVPYFSMSLSTSANFVLALDTSLPSFLRRPDAKSPYPSTRPSDRVCSNPSEERLGEPGARWTTANRSLVQHLPQRVQADATQLGTSKPWRSRNCWPYGGEGGIDSGLRPSPYERRVRVVQNRLRRFCRTPLSISRVRIPASSLPWQSERKRREIVGRMAEREGFEPSMGF
jgi:hypothetical protein